MKTLFFYLSIGLITPAFVYAQVEKSAKSAVSVKPTVSQVENQNIPGGDYKSFELKSGETCQACIDACLNDPNCKAYTYVKPGVQNQNAVCWLKSAVSNPVSDPNCISGVKTIVKGQIQTVSITGASINKAITTETTDDNGNLILTDRDGNSYKTVTIGYQIWMAENLKTTRYSDGSAILNGGNPADWTNTNSGAYCWYNNDLNYKNIYGALYNWMAVETGKICPAGWHVPSSIDWRFLCSILGGDKAIGGAGGLLKETGLAHWKSPNNGATNESGFTALPAGFRDKLGGFDGLGEYTYFWSTLNIEQYYSEYGKSGTNTIRYNNAGLTISGSGEKREGHSVRCLRNIQY